MTYYPDFFTSAFKMFSALLLVLGIVLACFYLMRRLAHREGFLPGTRLTRVVNRTPIGVKKNITIIEVAGRFLVLGVTHDRISLLTQIDDPESVERLTSPAADGPVPNFTGQLSRLLKKARPKDTGLQASPSRVGLK